MAEPRKILLGEDELPSAWFNIVPSMPTKPDPYLHPQTREPVGPDALAPLFPMALIGQEVSTDEWVDIPGPVLDVYKLWRPTPIRARPERPSIPGPHLLQVRGGSPAGPTSPTPPSPRRSTTRRASPGSAPRPGPASGAAPRLRLCPLRPGVQGLHGPRLLRRQAVPALDHGDLGGECHPVAVAGDQRRPPCSTRTRTRPSLGIAISEAVEDAATPARTPTTRSAACSTDVLLHQTVIGLELKMQLERAEVEPDVLVACVGGGSIGGFPLPVENLAGRRSTRVVAVEPTAALTTEGRFDYDLGDQAGMTR